MSQESAFFWTSTQLLTVSSQLQNPISTGGRALDIFMEIWAITVIARSPARWAAFSRGVARSSIQ